MNTTSSDSNVRTWRRRFGMAAQLLGVGVAAGLLVYVILFGARLDAGGLFWSIIIGTAYSVSMWSAQNATARWLQGRVRLDSARSVAMHAGVQALSIAVSFLLVSLLLDWLLPFALVGNIGMLGVIVLVALLISLVANGFYYLSMFYRQAREAEQAALRAELQALRAQINPHFLFNSLNSIVALIRNRPADAEMVTESLADLFRYSLHASDRSHVRLSEEVGAVEMYLTIERTRYGQRLDVSVEIPPSLKNVGVPGLVLQPLVENAIKHGVGRTNERCHVRISAHSEGEQLVLRVEDSGPGFDSTDTAVVMQRGTGLRNVHDRLVRQFGSDASMRIEPNAVEISLPLLRGVYPAALPSIRES
jgi:signal transduction histidine kinase